MTIQPSNDTRPAPEFTTVGRYIMNRLGEPSLLVEFVETRRAWKPVRVLQARDDDQDGMFEVLVLKTDQHVEVGTIMYSGDTLVGTVVSVSKPTLYQEAVVSVGLPNSAEIDLRTRELNKFGNEMQLPGGRSWTYYLSATQPAHLQLMQRALGRIAVTVVATALAKLRVNKSQAQVEDAIADMAADGDTLDAVIAEELENFELDRRSGAWLPEDGTTNGDVPQ